MHRFPEVFGTMIHLIRSQILGIVALAMALFPLGVLGVLASW